MSKANKCDRCGTLFEYEYETYLHKHFIGLDCHPYPNEFLDLCPLCQKDLERWITYPTRIKEKQNDSN